MADDCCEKIHPNKRSCPVSGTECAEVSARTIVHHIKHAWQWEEKPQRYFYCDDPGCAVAYFGEDDSVILFGEGQPVGQVALWMGTIPYEVLTTVGQRVKRIYFEE